MMPELDGYDVRLALRQDPSTIKIPFIFLSAKAAKDDFRKGMSLGADDYLTKPFTPRDLREAISIRLEKQTMMMARYAQELELAMGSLPTDRESTVWDYFCSDRECSGHRRSR